MNPSYPTACWNGLLPCLVTAPLVRGAPATVEEGVGIGASDAQKRVPEVFRRYFLERPPHPGGGYGLTPYQMFEQKIWIFSKKPNFRKSDFFQKNELCTIIIVNVSNTTIIVSA